MELIKKCIKQLDVELKVAPLQNTVVSGEQTDTTTIDALKQGDSFKIMETKTDSQKGSAHSAVKYDLIGRLSVETQLTRSTIAAILQSVNRAV